ncbi:peptidylprolyl isomerase [Citromicrobium sp. JLT1363]|uniref:peptidylprolyl isomerase n=1 Tax=Citromicrobium sp. JLT1363 TaxID=517722 RepID=UPI000225E6E2|nr:peptidylprolyl isomerase [Citromicrobium sp. JLT1363]
MKHAITLAVATLALTTASIAQEAETPAPSPGEIVNAASQDEWVIIDPEDLVVMTLPPLEDGTERKVVMQLIGEPFSQGWVENIRTLARARYWDGSAILRVQDNYVVQWGQPDPDMGVEAKPVPAGLKVMDEGDYTADTIDVNLAWNNRPLAEENRADYGNMDWSQNEDPAFHNTSPDVQSTQTSGTFAGWHQRDSYAEWVEFFRGWPVATEGESGDAPWWPVHCYGMVGVGRNMSPDTGDGSQLYTVIGHAPRHLDRNIAVVGRIIEGIEHLSSLPRGKGPLGFYEDPEKRVPIVSVRIGADLPQAEQPRFEYLATDSESFARYTDARANRRDPFFIVPAGGADICNIPVPVRRFEIVAEEG